MRMDVDTFDYILSKIERYLVKKWCNLHTDPILPEQRLVVCIRFLATGHTYSQLSFSFRMGVSTVQKIVIEVMDVIWKILFPVHMPIPTRDHFMKIAEQFHAKWGFPHCLGSIDGRHVRIKKPSKSFAKYYNYKNFFSVVFQACVDANYKYICIDVGGCGSQSDGCTYRFSTLKRAIDEKKLKIPAMKRIKNSTCEIPFFFVGDGAYPLSNNLMKPFPGKKLSRDQILFNRKLSRARAVVENAFGYTCQKWRIFYTTIQTSPITVNKLIKSTCLLHNIIIDREGCIKKLLLQLTHLKRLKKQIFLVMTLKVKNNYCDNSNYVYISRLPTNVNSVCIEELNTAIPENPEGNLVDLFSDEAEEGGGGDDYGDDYSDDHGDEHGDDHGDDHGFEKEKEIESEKEEASLLNNAWLDMPNFKKPSKKFSSPPSTQRKRSASQDKYEFDEDQLIETSGKNAVANNIRFFQTLIPHVLEIEADDILEFRNEVHGIVQSYAHPTSNGKKKRKKIDSNEIINLTRSSDSNQVQNKKEKDEDKENMKKKIRSLQQKVKELTKDNSKRLTDCNNYGSEHVRFNPPVYGTSFDRQFYASTHPSTMTCSTNHYDMPTYSPLPLISSAVLNRPNLCVQPNQPMSSLPRSSSAAPDLPSSQETVVHNHHSYSPWPFPISNSLLPKARDHNCQLLPKAQDHNRQLLPKAQGHNRHFFITAQGHNRHFLIRAQGHNRHFFTKARGHDRLLPPPARDRDRRHQQKILHFRQALHQGRIVSMADSMKTKNL
uniref:DDE Tnp4 domain-containing protein n=1 Tax=Trichogramma kaykai TaxID=54128 RepID=A0ABD2WA75_9HYME